MGHFKKKKKLTGNKEILFGTDLFLNSNNKKVIKSSRGENMSQNENKSVSTTRRLRNLNSN